MTALVEVEGLTVAARNDFGEETRIVQDVGFTLASGEVLALIGRASCRERVSRCV